MTGRQPFRLTLFALCLALLCARLGGAHLHLCLDGQEAPVSVHASEPGHSDAHHGDPAHSDQDVSLVGEAVTPLSKLFMDLPTALVVLRLGIDGQRIGHAIRSTRLAARTSRVRFHHPPLRGPPFLSR
ncbi:MAG: hypothetical protein AB7N69_05965 [Immundisolibacter sp.]|uniref:hypothetical protein n=1 Tax=Immundisolibacter sp. TaxID=1934948 RepID=UPI003D0D24B6